MALSKFTEHLDTSVTVFSERNVSLEDILNETMQLSNSRSGSSVSSTTSTPSSPIDAQEPSSPTKAIFRRLTFTVRRKV